MFPIFLSRLKAIKNWFRSILAQRWEFFKVFGTLLFGIVLIGGLYWWFVRFFSYLASVAVVGPLLTQKLLEIAFLSGFSLIALSAMVASLSTHYGSSDLGFLFSTPLKNISIFLMKSLETAIHASWMVALVLVPFLMALVKVKRLDFGFIVLACLLFIPFAFSAVVGGITLSSVFVWLFPKRKLTEFLSVLGIFIFIFLYAGLRLTLPHKLIHPERMEEVLEYLLYLQTPAAPLFPSRWYVESLNAYQAGDWTRFDYSIFILLAFGFLAFILTLILGTKIITRRKWLQVWEGGSGGVKPEAVDLSDFKFKSPSSLQKILFLKELKFFLRDSQRFTNSSFILAVIVIYLVSIYKLPMDTPYMRNFLSLINLALGLFIMAALSLRFCFPQMSLELPFAWFLKASPLEVRRFVGSKILFNFLFLNGLGLIMMVLSPFLLGIDLVLIPIYVLAAVSCGSVFSVLSIAIGSAFPKKRWENIIQVETSFGGFLYAVCALAFVALTLAVFAWPLRFYFEAKYLGQPMAWPHWSWLGILSVGYFGISGALELFGFWITKRSWLRLEV